MTLVESDEKYFRRYSIKELAGSGKRVIWSAADQRLFRQHAARYQMSTKEMLTLGTDELMTGLGISARSQEYKQIVWKRVLSALEYLVCTKLRHNTLIQAPYKDPHTGSTKTAWRWPKYTIEWLRSDWDGVEDGPDDDDSNVLRDEDPGDRAATPGPAREPSANGTLYTLPEGQTENPVERQPGRLPQRRGTEGLSISINNPRQNSTRPAARVDQRQGTGAAPIVIDDPPSDGEVTPTQRRNSSAAPRINATIASRARLDSPTRRVPIRQSPTPVSRTLRVPQTPRSSIRTPTETLELAEQSRVEAIIESLRSLPSPPQEAASIYDDPNTWPDPPTDEEIRQIQQAQRRSPVTFLDPGNDHDDNVSWEPLYPTLPSLPLAPPPRDALSQKALEAASESLKYAVHEMKYWTLAEIAAGNGDEDGEYRSTCAAKYAGVMREETALQAWRDAQESCQTKTGDEIMSPIWTLLLKLGRFGLD